MSVLLICVYPRLSVVPVFDLLCETLRTLW